MFDQGLVHQLAELLFVVGQHLGALLKGQSLRAVASVVRHMAAGLVRQQLDLDVVVHRVLQQVHDISVVGNGYGFFLLHIFLCHTERLCRVLDHQAHPALAVAGLDTGSIHLCNDSHAPCDLYGFRLCAAHPAKAAGHEQMAGQVSVLRHAQELTSRVQDGVEGSVHDTLRSDVHPASGCHLSIGGAAHSCGLCPVLRVIEHAHHQAVGHDDTRAGLVGFEQAHGMAAHHHQGVLICELL